MATLTINGITSYSMADLRHEAQWAIGMCPEGNGKHLLKVKEINLRIHPNAGTGASLSIIGECKKHHYQATIFHGI